MTFMTATTAVFLCVNNGAKANPFDPTYSQPLTDQEVCDTIEQKPLATEELKGNIQRQRDTAEGNPAVEFVMESGIYYRNGWCWVSANQNAKKRHAHENQTALGTHGLSNNGTLVLLKTALLKLNPHVI